jgi:hypothetical protein
MNTKIQCADEVSAKQHPCFHPVIQLVGGSLRSSGSPWAAILAGNQRGYDSVDPPVRVGIVTYVVR